MLVVVVGVEVGVASASLNYAVPADYESVVSSCNAASVDLIVALVVGGFAVGLMGAFLASESAFASVLVFASAIACFAHVVFAG